MTYDEAITTLETASKREKLYPIYLRLERMRLLFEALQIDPASPSIHIGGTSGKGSTSSLCAEVLQAAGYTVGLHMTPHLQTPRERMQVNGIMPSEEEFADLVATVFQAAVTIENTRSFGAYNSQELPPFILSAQMSILRSLRPLWVGNTTRPMSSNHLYQ